jgi:GNAT superfamily N-acetyltransferase
MTEVDRIQETVYSPEQLTELTPSDVDDFAALLPQLSSKELTSAEIADNLLATIESPNSAVFVVRGEDGRIRASATGGLCRIPTGIKAWVDDVVTDERHRGNGYGAALMDAVHGWMLEQGATSSNLTSKPERVAAGGLYERLGYVQRNTRVYRAALPAGQAAVKHS